MFFPVSNRVMKHIYIPFCLLLSCLSCRSIAPKPTAAAYTVIASAQDRPRLERWQPVFQKSAQRVTAFFGHPYPIAFTVVIHPDRHSLDSCWQHDWQMPDFHSECWMVASGVGPKLDLLSPEIWNTASCEHDWNDSLASTRLIAHEMTHVFHGQHNPSPDFSQTKGIDWFVEGLAVFSSGQYDQHRIEQLRKWLQANKAPENLDLFWSGAQKYGLAGSIVMYIDQQIGRKKLYKLLIYTTKEEILQALSIDEASLIKDWKRWIDEGGDMKYYKK